MALYQKVIAAKSAGFCHGVDRAVKICEQAAQEHSSRRCVTLGAVIHNEHAINDLKHKGIESVSDISEITPQDIVIIRSHGAGKAEYDALCALGARVIDATCLHVRRTHDIVHTQSQEGRLILIVGKRDHPEIVAITGWCDKHKVIETAKELDEWLNSLESTDIPVSVVSQTTNSKAQYCAFATRIKKECTNLRIFDTICNTAYERQSEAVNISEAADVMIVVGDTGSANSLKLVEICKEHCKSVYFIQSANDIKPEMFLNANIAGITAGASTPAFIIKEVIAKMSMEEIIDGTSEHIEEAAQSDLSVTSQIVEPEAAAADGGTTAEVESKEEVLEDAEPNEAVSSEVAPEVAVSDEPAPEAAAADEPAPEAEASDETAPEAVPDESAPEAAASDEPAPEVVESSETAPEESAPQEDSMESFEEMLEKSIKMLRVGERVSGTVTTVTSTEVSVDLGTKQSGYIPITDFLSEENTDIDEIIKVGDTIEAFVTRVNDVEGMVSLSKKRLDSDKSWGFVETAKDNKAIVTGMVIQENKGGIVVNVRGVHVFVPASQSGLPKNTPMTELLRKTVRLRVNEVNQSRRRVVGSIRDAQKEERREKSDKLWTEMEVGKKYDGVVKSMTSYGVFVDIGGVDGMIHISELSWTRIKQPSEILSVGDEIPVYVISFDKESRKISLGYRKSEDNPWTKFVNEYSVGDVVNVKIVKMMPFGAFAEICTGIDGLIHISQIAEQRIGLPSEVLSEGQKVDVKITEIDNDRKKVSLSIKALIEPPIEQVLSEAEIEEDDGSPVIVYDTDRPPVSEEEPEEPA